MSSSDQRLISPITGWETPIGQVELIQADLHSVDLYWMVGKSTEPVGDGKSIDVEIRTPWSMSPDGYWRESHLAKITQTSGACHASTTDWIRCQWCGAEGASHDAWMDYFSKNHQHPEHKEALRGERETSSK